jgi:ketosteroid isomerase-like protein
MMCEAGASGKGFDMKLQVLMAIALFATADLAQADPAADNAAAEKHIRAALAQWTEAANRGDFKSAFDVWAPDLIGWAPEGADDTYQREAEFAKAPPRAPKTTYALTINEVIVEGSLGVVRDTWTEKTKQESAPDKINTFRSFEVWRRQPDKSWKISRWIDGPLQPATTTAPSSK